MIVRYPMGILHSFSIKKIFYEKMDLRIFFSCRSYRIPVCIRFIKKRNDG